jgi:hypothetical protein
MIFEPYDQRIVNNDLGNSRRAIPRIHLSNRSKYLSWMAIRNIFRPAKPTDPPGMQ